MLFLTLIDTIGLGNLVVEGCILVELLNVAFLLFPSFFFRFGLCPFLIAKTDFFAEAQWFLRFENSMDRIKEDALDGYVFFLMNFGFP